VASRGKNFIVPEIGKNFVGPA